ncbi:MAG TPA: hypothetical protein VFI47_04225 [Acidimicrobiales bacterium]|nr:hypothetical protein [Acidimicrobiales bacterium]
METTTTPRPAPAAAAPARPATGPAALAVVPRVARPRWLTAYVSVLVAVDTIAIAVATMLAKLSWVGFDTDEFHVRWMSIPYPALLLVTVPTWLVILALAGAYDIGPFGSTAGMWTRVVRAGAQLLAVVALSYYLLHLAMVGRGVLAAMIPLAVALTLAGRAAVVMVVARLRRQGRARRTALVVGSRAGVDAVVDQLTAMPQAGIVPVATEVLAPGPGGEAAHAGVVVAALARSRAAALIVAGGLPQGQLRDVAWSLEGTGVELLVTPAPTEIGGLRSHIRPVAGLPLLYVD